MIDVVTEAQGVNPPHCLNHTTLCWVPSLRHPPCFDARSGCGYTLTPWEEYLGLPKAIGSGGLSSLKEQLRAALAQVEEQERVIEAESLPKTREEAEGLEQKLLGALEEVQRLKHSF
ncbi:MAG TPA: hypothetical protein VMM92_14845, partial [Thermoanaerobaculia bacterium]|nr:hypothetical protein [Thermoanaerobaculia bacterium]